ncbi:YceD family protein [Xylocopilactobacillus apis]|uniref:DUF177 domain-containing protein n=1 Tax=Xylocopilactobacillus apis TaxID=2932183 RepID=A0AAU9D176_9LACO|nr:YceD family protein [Xylocopilactobacillus apis]BDR56231.1 hypothetical protein KIMC2_07930 [Xylocopilactobacillus apis]
MKLTFDFGKILERKENTIFQGKVDLSEAIKERSSEYQADVPFDLKITLEPIEDKYIDAYIDIQGLLIVPSTRSLKPAEVKINQHVEEIFVRLEEDIETDEEDDRVITKVENNNLDLYNTVVDYILLGIPSQVLTEKEQQENLMPKGENWQVISEDHFESIKKDSDKLPKDTLSKLEKLKEELGKENNE